MWIGKLLGGVFGFLLFGPVGAVLGIFLGHFFDRNHNLFSGQNADVKHAFFEALFATMGQLAKADGRVSENEVQVARQIMQHMRLSAEQTRQAMQLFNRGKQPDFDASGYIAALMQVCRYRRNVLRMFMQLLLQAAHADGVPQSVEQQFLAQVAQQLGFSQREFEQLFAMFTAQYQFRQQWQSRGQYQHSSQQQQSYRPSASDLSQAYAVLGVQPSASMDEVKKAYRKLINQYHPDKLVAKGLPDEMMQAAKEKSQEIQQAYDAIKKARGK